LNISTQARDNPVFLPPGQRVHAVEGAPARKWLSEIEARPQARQLIVVTELFQATAAAEGDAALVMLEQLPGQQRVTVGADKA
jgi:hypothetical protein